jgi:hypothetical protein
VTLLVLIRVFVVTPNPIPMTNSYGILIELEGDAYGLIWDIGQVPSMDFDWLLCPLGSPSSILQLESELVWSLVRFNRICDSNATWRKVL